MAKLTRLCPLCRAVFRNSIKDLFFVLQLPSKQPATIGNRGEKSGTENQTPSHPGHPSGRSLTAVFGLANTGKHFGGLGHTRQSSNRNIWRRNGQKVNHWLSPQKLPCPIRDLALQVGHNKTAAGCPTAARYIKAASLVGGGRKRAPLRTRGRCGAVHRPRRPSSRPLPGSAQHSRRCGARSVRPRRSSARAGRR